MKMFINNNQRNASLNNIDILLFFYQIGEDVIRPNTHHEWGCREQGILKWQIRERFGTNSGGQLATSMKILKESQAIFSLCAA